jgi:hypothetical protein
MHTVGLVLQMEHKDALIVFKITGRHVRVLRIPARFQEVPVSNLGQRYAFLNEETQSLKANA